MIAANGSLRAKDRQGDEPKLRVNDAWMEGTKMERSQRVYDHKDESSVQDQQ